MSKHKRITPQKFTTDLETALDQLPSQGNHFFWLDFIDTINTNRKGFDLKALLKTEKFRYNIGVYSKVENLTIFLTQSNINCSKANLDRLVMKHTVDKEFYKKAYGHLINFFYSGIVVNNCDMTCSIISFLTSIINDANLYVSLCSNRRPLFRLFHTDKKNKTQKSPDRKTTFQPYIIKAINMIYNLIKFLNYGCIHLVFVPENDGDTIARYYRYMFYNWLFPCVLTETFDYLDDVMMRKTRTADAYKRGPTLYLLMMRFERAVQYLEIYGDKNFFYKKVPIIFTSTYRPTEDGIKRFPILKKLVDIFFL
ncbi:hypothetical protein HELRODRAFT_165606 [Helobdella robusta]|uniref:Uncharacterized protein n=1 Tax=Helobdella robusta TaxID=6412 RepID=T1EX25_HELRO|nr:hypothetical protein HELRODRAFT_165606 [Helobdella robusta]ESN91553.1 hypothetical protein HELRODRAFT_165606 [Helobdella robusta]